MALLFAALTFAPPIFAQSPPATPSTVTVTRADGSLTATWPSVDGATHYHVTYSSTGGASWQLAALSHTGTSITITADNANTYIVGVRAKNDNGGSGWRNSAAAGPYTPPNTPTPPDAVASVSVTRADGTLTASWAAPSGATSYHVTYTDNGGTSWQLAALSHTGTSITFNADNAKTYIVGVRAKNGSGGSGWRNSPASGPFTPTPTPPARPTGLTATAGDGSVTLSWDDPADATITGYEYRTRWTGVAWGAWQSIPSGTSYTVDSLTNGTEYRFKVRAVNAVGSSGAAPGGSPWYAAATPNPPTLTADPTPTSAALTMDNYSGEWYYTTSETSGGGGAGIASAQSVTCTGPVYGSETTITGLDPNSNYTITAYGNNQCGGAFIASATAQTMGQISLTPSAETTDGATLTITGYMGNWWYEQTSPNSSVCAPASGATATITGLLPGRAYTYAAYGNEKCHPSSNTLATATFTTQYELRADGVTENSATLVIEGSGTLTNWWYKRTAPSGDDTCRASGYTQKSVALSLAPGQSYTYVAYGDSGCSDQIGSVSFKTPGLNASADTNAYTLTLTIVNWTKADGTTTAAWWYRQTAPTAGTCTSVAEGTSSVTLTGFTFDHTNRNQYVFKAYGKAGCDAADAIARTHLFPASSSRGGVENVTATTATFLAYNTGTDSTWGYKSTETGAPCEGPFDGVGSLGVASAPVTGLTPGTTYTFQAYASDQNNPCSARFDSNVTFTTAKASVSNLGERQVGTTMPVGRSANHWTASAFTTGTGADSFTLDRISLLFGDSGIGMPAPEYDLNVRLFSAGGISLSNLGQGSGNAFLITKDYPAAQPFTTGSWATGYTLKTVKLDLNRVETGAGAPVVTLREADATNGANPSATVKATLSGSVPVPLYAPGEFAFTCSTGCDLDANTTYFIHVASTNPGASEFVYWNGRNTDETLSPDTAGWSLGDNTRRYQQSGQQRVWSAVNPGALSITTVNGGNPDAAIANATLSGPARPAENSTGVYTCTGSGCALAPDTDYFVVLSVPVPQCREVVPGVQDCSGTTGRAYYWQRSGTNNETASPADSGFSIANETRHTHDGGSSWTRLVRAVMFSVEYAMPAPSLTASDIAASTATLTLANEGGESAWYAKRLTPAGGTCSSAISNGATLGLTNLQQNTSYTYAAYRDSGCTQVAASGTFTTLRTLTASNVTDTTATLALSGSGTGNWYAKYTTPSGGTCSSGVGYGGALDLSNLGRNTAYTYEAYSDSACTTVIGRTSFTTEANWIAVSGIGTTGATLTLTGHTGTTWSLKRTSPTTGTCAVGETDLSHALSSLTKGTTYSYTAYSDASCGTELRSVTFKTLIDSPTNVTYITGTAQNRITTVAWDRNGAASGAVGYEARGRAGDGAWTHFWTIAPTTGDDLTFAWTYFGARIDTVQVRATQGGYHSEWVDASLLGGGN